MPYYHAAPIELATNSVLSIGNFGRYIRSLTPKRHGTDGWYVAQEMIWETVRERNHPEKPSRFSSVMAFTDSKQAEQFALSRIWRFVVYEIEPQEANTPIHIGGYNLFDWPPAEQPYWHWATTQAGRYWRGEAITVEEAIIGGPCRVVSRIA